MSEPIVWTNCQVRLGELKRWEDNPAEIGKEAAGRLVDSFNEFGQVETLAIDPDNMLIDGHQRLDVWQAKFGSDMLVDCRRSSRVLTIKERQKIAVLLRSGAVGRYNWDAIANWDAGDLQSWGFDIKTLDDWQTDVRALGNFLDSNKDEPQDAEPQIDRAAELNEKWQVKIGDLWQIGEHRLLCGDSTIKADVDRVMGDDHIELVWTDPPYGVSVGDKNKYLNAIARSNRVEENLENDTLDESGIVDMLSASFDNTIEHCTAGAGWYVAAPPGPLHVLFGQVLKDRGIWRQTIQWVKNNSTFSPMGVCYHWQAEPIFFGWLPNGGHRFYGGRKQTTVWNIDRPMKNPEHPTMKPVELVERAIENSSIEDEIVADFFCGSGTTMVACENLHRKCRAIEISPNYCAVILERMATAFPDLIIEKVQNDNRTL